MALTKSVREIIADDRTGLLSRHASWERVKLDDVVVVLNGFAFESKYFSSDSGTPLIRIRDVVAGETDTFYTGEFDRQYLVQPGELLIGMDGDFNSARWRSAPGLLNQRVCKLTVDERFYSGKLLEYVLPGYLSAINAETSSVTVKHLSSRTVEDIELPLPPLQEQSRIVAKLEELLSDLDAGAAEIKAAQMKLAQYRHSLLKAAVDGALTAEWRKHNKPKETGAQLLERILEERRARWEEKQLARYQEQGKSPPKGWREKYPEPVQPSAGHLPELPEGWVWATISQLTIEQKYGSSAKTHEDANGVPVIRMGNIQDGDLDLQDRKYLPVDHDEFPDLHLADGDLLFNRTNSPELVGKSAIYRSQIVPCSFASYLIAVRFASLFVPEFAAAYINSVYGRNWVKSVVVQQVGQANVNGTKLAALSIPLPPRAEQEEIVQRMMQQRDNAIRQQSSLESSLRQAEMQRKNILKTAFSGRLTPQDPKDEPAKVLLERIRAERLAKAQSTNKRAARKTA